MRGSPYVRNAIHEGGVSTVVLREGDRILMRRGAWTLGPANLRGPALPAQHNVNGRFLKFTKIADYVLACRGLWSPVDFGSAYDERDELADSPDPIGAVLGLHSCDLDGCGLLVSYRRDRKCCGCGVRPHGVRRGESRHAAFLAV